MQPSCNIIRYAAACAVLLLLIGCSHGGPPVTPLTETEIDAVIAAAPPEFAYHDEARQREAKGYEASKWIATSGNFAPFASNHFKTRAAALEFVRNLYRLGAKSVYVGDIMDEPTRIKREGGPYADALYVLLPADHAHRQALFEVEAQEAKAAGFGPTEDKGQEQMFFWWD